MPGEISCMKGNYFRDRLETFVAPCVVIGAEFLRIAVAQLISLNYASFYNSV